MCDFISWIELLDGTLVYLEDEDVFSSRGNEVLTGCRDNDVLGHGAIDLYYGLRGAGVSHEVRDFWNTHKLPEELAAKIISFDQHWGEVWRSGCFQNDDLRYIIRYAPDDWATKAWERLLRQNPSNHDLIHIICCAPDDWATKAWERLLRQSPSNDDLFYIIRYASDDWAAKARVVLDNR